MLYVCMYNNEINIIIIQALESRYLYYYFYYLHASSFPLGMLFFLIISEPNSWQRWILGCDEVDDDDDELVYVSKNDLTIPDVVNAGDSGSWAMLVALSNNL